MAEMKTYRLFMRGGQQFRVRFAGDPADLLTTGEEFLYFNDGRLVVRTSEVAAVRLVEDRVADS